MSMSNSYKLVLEYLLHLHHHNVLLPQTHKKLVTLANDLQSNNNLSKDEYKEIVINFLAGMPVKNSEGEITVLTLDEINEVSKTASLIKRHKYSGYCLSLTLVQVYCNIAYFIRSASRKGSFKEDTNEKLSHLPLPHQVQKAVFRINPKLKEELKPAAELVVVSV